MAQVLVTCDEATLSLSGNTAHCDGDAWTIVPYSQLPPLPLSNEDTAWLLGQTALIFLIAFSVRTLRRLLF